MITSRNIRDGDIVAFRGGKVIKCGGHLKPRGVWSSGQRCVTITLAGDKVVTELPSGIRVYGEVTVKVLA